MRRLTSFPAIALVIFGAFLSVPAASAQTGRPGGLQFFFCYAYVPGGTKYYFSRVQSADAAVSVGVFRESFKVFLAQKYGYPNNPYNHYGFCPDQQSQAAAEGVRQKLIEGLNPKQYEVVETDWTYTPVASAPAPAQPASQAFTTAPDAPSTPPNASEASAQTAPAAPDTSAQAQNTPVAGTAVVVRMIDAVDSGSDPAGKQYRASVTRQVNASNNVTIAQGAAASVVLTRNGSNWTAQLTSLTINNQAVAVTSVSANLTAGAQNAVGNAANAVGSVLGRFGKPKNVPPTVAAVATGQRVFLPPGTTLSFVLGAAPSADAAAPAPQPAAVQMTTGAAVVQSSLGQSQGQQGQFYYCQGSASQGKGLSAFTGVFQSEASNDTVTHAWQQYFYDKYPAGSVGFGAGCVYASSQADLERNLAAQEKDPKAQQRLVQIDWKYTPDQAVAASATPPQAAATPAPSVAAASSPGQTAKYFISCSTSPGPGVDTYYTDVFPTDRIKVTGHGMASGYDLNSIESILNDFQKYLTQKGYKYLPGTRAACDVSTDEQRAKAAKHRRAYEGNPCGNCGKVVETGWKE